MTVAQKKARENFKKAIAYRKKTGCSLKQAFAYVKGGKVTGVKKAVVKKKAVKKVVRKKAAKKIGAYKVIQKGENKNARVTKTLLQIRSKKGSFKGYKKITGIPQYKDKDAAREIELYADNNGQLYYSRRKPILLNLQKKYKAGKYNVELAAKLWMYYINDAMQRYNKEFGSRGDKWSDLLSVSDRKLLAYQYAIDTKNEFDLGNFII